LVAEEGYTSPVTASSVQFIDTATNKITGAIPLPPQVFASWISITPDGRTAYVINEGYYLSQTGPGTTTAVNSVLIVDIASRTITGSVLSPAARGGSPIHLSRLAVSPDGTLLYVTATPGPDRVFVIDTLTNTIIKTIAFEIGGLINNTQVIFYPDGTRAYVTGYDGRSTYLGVIDTTNHEVVKTIPLGPFPATLPAG